MTGPSATAKIISKHAAICALLLLLFGGYFICIHRSLKSKASFFSPGLTNRAGDSSFDLYIQTHQELAN
jgi:hypothetical protein